MGNHDADRYCIALPYENAHVASITVRGHIEKQIAENYTTGHSVTIMFKKKIKLIFFMHFF